jgi:hypothetical protein
MGNCIYCGNKAGLLSNKHKDCENRYIQRKQEIIDTTSNTIVNGTSLEILRQNINSISKDSFIKEDELDKLLALGYDTAVDKFLSDGILSKEEENKAAEFYEFFNLPQAKLNENSAHEKLVKSSILRELVEGKIPDSKIAIAGNLPFNFLKGENLIWLFQDVDYYEQRIKTHYQGGYSGVSIKVAKGLYYRTGTFRGNPVRTTEMTLIAGGILAITNKHIYFSSNSKSFRIKYDKVITFDPYEDGLGLQKDGANSKPQIFKNIDGWFAFNLVQNLAKL